MFTSDVKFNQLLCCQAKKPQAICKNLNINKIKLGLILLKNKNKGFYSL